MIEILLFAILAVTVFNLVIQLKKSNARNSDAWKQVKNELIKFDHALDKTEKTIRDEFRRNREEGSAAAKESRNELAVNLKSFAESNAQNNKELNDLIRLKFADFHKQQSELNKQSADLIREVRDTIEKQLKAIRSDNDLQLNEMRKTVDEKLQTTLEKRLGESFKQVSDRLEQVHKGLGEMQNIATGVGDLKRVLTNVKTRGVLGEYQLENILEQLLTPDQYSKNVATKKGSRAHVEFAVKLPGKDSDDEVWMPVDSKFPIENYHLLLDAYEKGDQAKIEATQKVLVKTVELFAKEISTKYIDPPHTTDFAIMFLPVESLYAEVLRHAGLFENLQRNYHITIVGPTTLSALLNSLQMGFRTLAVQKRSSEVWKILEAVKAEFGKFTEQLDKVDKHINTASKSLSDLRLTRTNVMSRKLKDINAIESIDAEKVLDLKKLDDKNDE